MIGSARFQPRTHVFPRHHLYFTAVDLLYPPLRFSHPGLFDLFWGSLRSFVRVEAREQGSSQISPFRFRKLQGFGDDVASARIMPIVYVMIKSFDRESRTGLR